MKANYVYIPIIEHCDKCGLDVAFNSIWRGNYNYKVCPECGAEYDNGFITQTSITAFL